LAQRNFQEFWPRYNPGKGIESFFQKNWKLIGMTSDKSLQRSLARSRAVASSTTAAATAAELKR
jgi:hypothetical protein